MTAKLWNSGAAKAPRAGLAVLAACVFLAGCGDDDVILPGQREDIRSATDQNAQLAPESSGNVTRAISLPAPQVNAQWPQAIGTPALRTAHPALGPAPARIWTANIGRGDSRRQRITAAPVVAQGLVFTLDAEATVTATSLSGEQVWQNDLLPARETSGDATGGGLAWNDGRLFVSLGYGALVAVDAASGGVLWRQRLEGTGSGTPTAVGGLVYITAGDDQGWALTADEGRIVWQLRASPDVNNVLGAPAPAISDDLAIFGFGSGEIQAVFRRGGLRRWDASVLGERFGRAISNVGDVTAAPVIAGNRVYAGNQSGRLVALNLGSGERIWTAREGAVGEVFPAGDSVFAVSDIGQLLRLDAATGARIWGVQLATFVKDRPRRRAEIVAHHGPVLAGGRIHVASNDGFLRSFDPASGALTGTVAIPDGATSSPVVAGGVLYVVSTNGQLHAFR